MSKNAMSTNVWEPIITQSTRLHRINSCNAQVIHFIERRFTYHVSTQVNAQNGYCAKRKRNVQNDKHQEGTDLRDVTGQCVGNGLLQIVKDQTT